MKLSVPRICSGEFWDSYFSYSNKVADMQIESFFALIKSKYQGAMFE